MGDAAEEALRRERDLLLRAVEYAAECLREGEGKTVRPDTAREVLAKAQKQAAALYREAAPS